MIETLSVDLSGQCHSFQGFLLIKRRGKWVSFSKTWNFGGCPVKVCVKIGTEVEVLKSAYDNDALRIFFQEDLASRQFRPRIAPEEAARRIEEWQSDDNSPVELLSSTEEEDLDSNSGSDSTYDAEDIFSDIDQHDPEPLAHPTWGRGKWSWSWP